MNLFNPFNLFNVNKDSGKEGSGENRGGGILLLLILIAALNKGFGFFDAERNTNSRVTNTSDVVNRTEEFIGKTVTIRSKPINRIGFTSFAVSDRRFFGGDPIVVINATGARFTLPENRNAEVEVTGRVEYLDIPAVERRYKLNVRDEYYQRYIDKPAVIAQSLKIAPERERSNR
jgi:hypothetical protein